MMNRKWGSCWMPTTTLFYMGLPRPMITPCPLMPTAIARSQIVMSIMTVLQIVKKWMIMVLVVMMTKVKITLMIMMVVVMIVKTIVKQIDESRYVMWWFRCCPIVDNYFWNPHLPFHGFIAVLFSQIILVPEMQTIMQWQIIQISNKC